MSQQKHSQVDCDIFCRVIDNYGDIGVCWRLSRQLVQEAGLTVRLWIDALSVFARLQPEVCLHQHKQLVEGVEVCQWPLSDTVWQDDVAAVVIEAFGCDLPSGYREAFKGSSVLWLNLEYLSAEPWVESCHLLPSPQPDTEVKKYFFFPGFNSRTGGLLQEQGLLSQRQQFQHCPAKQQAFYHRWQISRQPQQWLVSMFCYPQAPLPALLHCWELSEQPVYCLLAEGIDSAGLDRFLGQKLMAGQRWQRGQLTVHRLPFLPQDEYDRVLWISDINFVRGEDSFVRAQWAARPMIWQIYPQQDGVHADKLQAFWQLYRQNLPADGALQEMWQWWNGFCTEDISLCWHQLLHQHTVLQQQAQNWCAQISDLNLGQSLLNFCQENGTIQPFS